MPTDNRYHTADLNLQVNGQSRPVTVRHHWTLLDVLREQLDLTGSKRGCDRGECGSCTVLLDGQPVYSCQLLAVQVGNRPILTIEGLAGDETLDAVQQAFLDNDGGQCGFCTPGFVMSTRALLNDNPNPTDAEIRQALSGNLCRCNAYGRIISSVQAARSGIGGGTTPPTAQGAVPEPEGGWGAVDAWDQQRIRLMAAAGNQQGVQDYLAKRAEQREALNAHQQLIARDMVLWGQQLEGNQQVKELMEAAAAEAAAAAQTAADYRRVADHYRTGAAGEPEGGWGAIDPWSQSQIRGMVAAGDHQGVQDYLARQRLEQERKSSFYNQPIVAASFESPALAADALAADYRRVADHYRTGAAGEPEGGWGAIDPWSQSQIRGMVAAGDHQGVQDYLARQRLEQERKSSFYNQPIVAASFESPALAADALAADYRRVADHYRNLAKLAGWGGDDNDDGSGGK